MAEREEASKAAKALSKLGAKKGGRARAEVLTSSERTEIAKTAARARWSKAVPTEDPEPVQRKPTSPEPMPFSLLRGTLTLGDVDIECHVLNDHRRVLTQREVVKVLTEPYAVEA